MDGMVSAMSVASAPTTRMDTRITQMISISDAFCRKISLYTFLGENRLVQEPDLPHFTFKRTYVNVGIQIIRDQPIMNIGTILDIVLMSKEK